MTQSTSIKFGVLPCKDGYGFRYDLEIDAEYIWVNGGALMIEPGDWEAFKVAVDSGLNALKQISK